MSLPGDGVISHTSQAVVTSHPTEKTVLLPLPGNLKLDINLQLSHKNFNQPIKDFYANKQLSDIDQLKATPPYPTPHVLAQFANKAYADNQFAEPKPPDGWQLLTTASNFGINNGYFGTAYWHPEHQQVVIAHRGTEFGSISELVTSPTKLVSFLKDFYTDIEGVVRNNYVPQINSASTFAKKVVSVLQEKELEKVSFELFFTGHSLGGWLAQITTFTTEYLEEKRGTFRMKMKTDNTHEVTNSYHPHTVVFDSPGCENMLLKMERTFNIRGIGRSFDFQHLDITSYLSAPNRFNTCNTHIGTIYRIFIDLSRMSWMEKHSALYNRATHDVDKFVQAFDPETVQESKDDKGRRKILEVVDWPVTEGLTSGAECKDFFKWAKHPNNYHPDVKDTVPNEDSKGYVLLRYQTKAYDECKNSLRVFTQDEREFLARYKSLRELQTQLNLKGCFSVMGDPEAVNKAQQNLQKYELDSESVRCLDASTLQTLIPYVKRLVRHFPSVKENIKDKLFPPDIMNMVYKYETMRNIDKIRQSALKFQTEAVGLTEFLKSNQQIWQLRMTNGDVWTGITCVYQALQNTPCTINYLSEGNCTVLTLDWLLAINGMINLNALLASKKEPHLLMIACGTNQIVKNELRNMFLDLFSNLKGKETVKIILTTQSENDITAFIEETLGKGFIKRSEQSTWSVLNACSRGKMLEKTVVFQGRKVALNQLTSAESMTDSLPLADLLQEKELIIGKEYVPSACSGYNEKYYIDRTFNHNIVIRQDIATDARAGNFPDLLASTEQEFQQLCQHNPTRNVHWLEKDTSGELFWQQSEGNLQALRKYIDNQETHSYAASDLDKLLQQAKHQRIMLIADKEGMGKTTVLTHLSKQIKDKFPAHWMVIIDLNDYTELLKAKEGKKMDKEGILEFVSKYVLNLESHLEKELFKKAVEGNEISKVVVMVDGFDEISPKYKKTAIDILQVLKQTSLEQLWITTRPHLREELENNLQQLSYTLQPFSEKQQVEFLKKFWLRNPNLEAMKPPRIEIYAEALIKNMAQTISDKENELTGIPLQTHMLAEIFKKDFRIFYDSDKTQPELPQTLKLLELYEQFLDRKYNVYCREKPKTPGSTAGAEEIGKRDVKDIKFEHQSLALQALFTEEQVAILQVDNDFKLPDEDLARIGIVQRNSEGKLQFIHRTFAEYLVAEFLTKELKENTKQRKQVQDILLNKVLLQSDCQVIRSFLDGFLESSKPTNGALKQYGEKLKQLKERENHEPLAGVTIALHTAAKEDNANIIEFLSESLKSGEDLNTVTEMLLATDRQGRTALHKAAKNDSIHSMKKIWEWGGKVTTLKAATERGHLVVLIGNSEASDTTRTSAEGEEMQPNQIKNKLLVAKDEYGNMAWHAAAQRGSVKALETLWSWAKKVKLNTNEFLLAQNGEGNTAWQLAAQTGHLEIFHELETWAKEVQLNRNELKNKLLLAEDQYGYTVWYRAAESGNLEALKTLWFLVTLSELTPVELLLAQDKKGNTAWQVATQGYHFEVLEKLWDWAKGENICVGVLKDKLLLTTDQYGNTAWHRAAEKGNLVALEALWSWAKEVDIDTDELKKNMLLAQDKKGETAWHLAANRDHFDVLKKMLVWAKEIQKNSNILIKEFLQTKDNYGYTAWHRAAQRGTLNTLEMLWGRAKVVD